MLAEQKVTEDFEDFPKVISLFSCGLGMDIGFENAGFKTVYTNDIAKFACDTIRKNKPEVPCDEGDITCITTESIITKTGVKKDGVDVIIGGPPCQSFSTAGLRKGFHDKRGMALLEFIRVVREVRPKFFVFENVAGLKSVAKKHVPFYERIKKNESRFRFDQKLGSLFKEILDQFQIRGYKVRWEILNAADFGVAQKRKRLILIGSRVYDPQEIFEEIHKMAGWADPKIAYKVGKKPWRTLKEVLQGLEDKEKECTKFPSWGKYLRYVPPGGCWVNIPKELQKEAMGGAADTDDPARKGNQGGRRGFYRRLSWGEPSPTLVTSPSQLGTCLCHPDDDRPLTVREYARIQGFPDNWKFVGTTYEKYRMIGEAVPIKLAEVIGKAIIRFLK